ncbi:ABC transporter ATP-binding protein [Spirosoma aerolatum]|uniref:ABC transporter ATP-binding protein n=1 Tax=Spirosoma aerolatum TaxID=1211326 RepID=UPI0009ADAF55|nr:ABC transporter ATP-binding protein [Spirosoma aerolatum]
MKNVFQLRDLTIGYQTTGRQPVLVAEKINLDLRAGEFVCLLGPNGAGKSTLLRTLAGMQKPLAGVAELDGTNVHELPPRALAKYLSVVLTEKVDGGLLTSYEIVSLGRYPYTNWSGQLTAHDHERIAWAIEQVGANGLAHRSLNELSDGERQRVMMARALAQEPQVMLLDEITAFLDLPRRVEVMQLLQKMAHETGRAVLVSTHDLDLALRSADRIWLLAKGGELVAGAPEDLVLDGSFERVFGNDGLLFDRQTGAFRLEKPLTRTVTLTGDGETYTWTKRALERSGFAVEPLATTRITIDYANGQPTWLLTEKSEPIRCDSIYHLMATLTQLH